jgi:hypothetical protein
MTLKVKFIIVLAIASTLIGLSTAQVSSTCPKAVQAKNFNATRLNGQWFLTNKIVNFETKYRVDTKHFKDFMGNCTYLNMTYTAKTNVFNVYSTTIIDGKSFFYNRTAKVNKDGSFNQKLKYLTCKLTFFFITLF